MQSMVSTLPTATTLPQSLHSLELASVYTRLHRRLKLPFRPALNRLLQSTELEVNVDLLSDKEVGQIAGLVAGLRPTPCIRLWSYEYESKARVSYGLPPSPQLDLDHKPWSQTPKTTFKLSLGLSVNLSHNPILRHLYLFDLILTEPACVSLAKGLVKAQTLEIVSVVHCGVTSNALAGMVESIKALERLKRLVLDQNPLGSQGGHCISRVISHQAQRRDRELWTQTLHTEALANPGLVLGLTELSLAENGLDDLSWEHLKNALEMDNWIKCINFRGNSFSEMTVKQIFSVYRRSKSLKIIDIRDISAAKTLFPTFLDAMKRRLTRKNEAESDFLLEKLREIEKNRVEIEGFPRDIVMKGLKTRSKPGSVNVSLGTISRTAPRRAKSVENDRKNRKTHGNKRGLEGKKEDSGGIKGKKGWNREVVRAQTLDSSIPQIPPSTSRLENQLQAALFRISTLEQQLTQSTAVEAQETLISKAERLVRELTATLDELDGKETLNVL